MLSMSSSAAPFSTCPQSFSASGSFPMSQLFASGGQRIGVSASASVLPVNILCWFPLGLTGLIFLLSKGLSRVFSNTTVQKHQFFGTSLLYGPTLTSIHDYGKTLVLTIQTFVSKVMSLLFNMLSRLVIAFLPRNKCILISWLQSPSTVILKPKKRKSVTASIFSPSFCHEVIGPDAIILVFRMLSFKPAFSLSSFIFISRLSSSSSLSTIRVVSSTYLRLLVFFPAILLPACDSSSPAFYMKYSAYKWNKQDDNIQLCHTPFPILNQGACYTYLIPTLLHPGIFTWS